VPIIGLATVVLFSFWMWRHHKLAYPAALVPTHVSLREPKGTDYPPLMGVSRGHLSIERSGGVLFLFGVSLSFCRRVPLQLLIANTT